MGKFVVREVDSGFKFDLKATNGQVVASSEEYASKASCLKGIESVKYNAPIANLENQLTEGYETAKNPKFEIYADKAKEFRFRLKAKNGEIVATSEGYKALDSCMKGIESVRKNSENAVVEPQNI